MKGRLLYRCRACNDRFEGAAFEQVDLAIAAVAGGDDYCDARPTLFVRTRLHACKAGMWGLADVIGAAAENEPMGEASPEPPLPPA